MSGMTGVAVHRGYCGACGELGVVCWVVDGLGTCCAACAATILQADLLAKLEERKVLVARLAELKGEGGDPA